MNGDGVRTKEGCACPHPTTYNMAAAANNADVLRMVVASDLHLGYECHDALQFEEPFEAFEEVLRMAVQHRADLVVLTGNIFHSPNPSRRILNRCIELLSRYSTSSPGTQLPVYVIHGDCDTPQASGQSALQLLCGGSLLHLLGSAQSIPHGTTPEGIPCRDLKAPTLEPVLIRKGATKVALYGLDHMPDKDFAAVRPAANEPRAADGTIDIEWMNVLAVHQRRFSERKDGNMPTCIDLVLWGHEHACRIADGMDELTPSAYGNFTVIQPGSTVRVRGLGGGRGSGRGSGRGAASFGHERTGKHVAIVLIHRAQWKMEPWPLTRRQAESASPASAATAPTPRASRAASRATPKPSSQSPLTLTALGGEVLWHMCQIEPEAAVLGCASRVVAARLVELGLPSLHSACATSAHGPRAAPLAPPPPSLRALRVLSRLPLVALHPHTDSLLKLLAHADPPTRLFAVITLRALLRLRPRAPSPVDDAFDVSLAALAVHPLGEVRSAALAVSMP